MSSENETTSETGTAEVAAAAGVVVGKVVSNKMDKTVSVAIERLVKHPVYAKFVRRTSKVMAHDEANACKEGDTVAIIECRPLSKRKAWRVIQIVESVDVQ